MSYGIITGKMFPNNNEFQCPVCKSETVLVDSMKNKMIFICQSCGCTDVVEPRYSVGPLPYYFLSGKNIWIPDMIGKN
jgi:transcription elongation factor Elf1